MLGFLQGNCLFDWLLFFTFYLYFHLQFGVIELINPKSEDTISHKLHHGQKQSQLARTQFHTEQFLQIPVTDAKQKEAARANEELVIGIVMTDIKAQYQHAVAAQHRIVRNVVFGKVQIVAAAAVDGIDGSERRRCTLQKARRSVGFANVVAMAHAAGGGGGGGAVDNGWYVC